MDDRKIRLRCGDLRRKATIRTLHGKTSPLARRGPLLEASRDLWLGRPT